MAKTGKTLKYATRVVKSMKKRGVVVLLLLLVFLVACEEQVKPVQPDRGNIPQIDIGAPTLLPEKPEYEPPPTPPRYDATASAGVAHKIEARLLEFLPSEIKVRKGDKVRLVITARDTDQHFYLDAFGIEEPLPLGEDVIIEFIAGKPGKYIYRSNVTGMEGLLIVQ